MCEQTGFYIASFIFEVPKEFFFYLSFDWIELNGAHVGHFKRLDQKE